MGSTLCAGVGARAPRPSQGPRGGSTGGITSSCSYASMAEAAPMARSARRAPKNAQARPSAGAAGTAIYTAGKTLSSPPAVQARPRGLRPGVRGGVATQRSRALDSTDTNMPRGPARYWRQAGRLRWASLLRPDGSTSYTRRTARRWDLRYALAEAGARRTDRPRRGWRHLFFPRAYSRRCGGHMPRHGRGLVFFLTKRAVFEEWRDEQ